MICKKCKAGNPAVNKFCGQCGEAFAAPPVPVPDMDGAYFCDRHKKVVTRVRCGRCDKPVCVKCTVFGPAGPRCKECSRNRVGLRPMGVLHEAAQGLNAPGVGRTVWYLAIWAFIISIFTGGHRD